MVKKCLVVASFLVACSSPTTVIVQLADGGTSSPPPQASTTPEQPPPGIGVTEAGTDAGSDSAPDAPPPTSCGNDTAGESLQQAFVEGPCDLSECAVPNAYHYMTETAVEPGNDRPPIAGCKRGQTDGTWTSFCCPPTCIRLKGADSDCANKTIAGPGAVAYECPNVVSPTAAGCFAYQTPTPEATTYCCPAP